MAAAAADDELEALPESVIDAVFGEKKAARRDDDELDAYEAHMGERKREKKKKKGKKAKRRAYERDGFRGRGAGRGRRRRGGGGAEDGERLYAREIDGEARAVGGNAARCAHGANPERVREAVTTRERARRGGRIPM